MPYPAEGERLFQIYSKDIEKMYATTGQRRPCEFHMGEWSGHTNKTTKGVDLTGTSGCLLNKESKQLTEFRATHSIHKAVLKTGYNCRNPHCNFKNDYACANQPDGTYLCFNCR